MKIFHLFLLLLIASCSSPSSQSIKQSNQQDTNSLVLADSIWKQRLSPDEFAVLREKATEKPYSGEYDQFWDSGTYVCKACGLELFRSDTKFDAGCGWPSFYQSISKANIREVRDTSHGMNRIEIQCRRCGGHLGHVFDDGPGEEGLRYCVNSLSLGFQKQN